MRPSTGRRAATRPCEARRRAAPIDHRAGDNGCGQWSTCPQKPPPPLGCPSRRPAGSLAAKTGSRINRRTGCTYRCRPGRRESRAATARGDEHGDEERIQTRALRARTLLARRRRRRPRSNSSARQLDCAYLTVSTTSRTDWARYKVVMTAFAAISERAKSDSCSRRAESTEEFVLD